LKNNFFAKFAKAVANMHREQRGMTGLETAIILIAFVTVAAVFGYAVLSAGLFSAERGKETIYAGLQQAKANMEISGSVIVESNSTAIPYKAKTIRFTVRNAIAGTPIDMTPPCNGVGLATGTAWNLNRCVMSLTTDAAYYNNIDWDMAYVGQNDGDALLEAGEQMEITITLVALNKAEGDGFAGGYNAAAAYATQPEIGTNDWFNIQVKPTQGSTMTIQRTLPAGLDALMDMH
jgi:flagellin FlaB